MESQTEQILIRLLSPDDTQYIKDIVLGINQEAGASKMLPISQEDIIQDTQNQLCCVAINSNDNIIGYGSITVWENEYGELRSLWVVPEYRGCGIGRKLIFFRESLIIERGWKPIALVNPEAGRIYKKMGYLEVCKSDVPEYFWDLCKDCKERSNFPICHCQVFAKFPLSETP